MDQPEVPPGFARHTRTSRLTAPWEPLYARTMPDALQIGFRAGPAHTNSRNFVHGGLISALADNAMGLSCGMQAAPGSGLVTVNLSVDFVGSAQIGQWVEIRPSVVRAGGTLCFATALVSAGESVCARASAVFPGAAAPLNRQALRQRFW